MGNDLSSTQIALIVTFPVLFVLVFCIIVCCSIFSYLQSSTFLLQRLGLPGIPWLEAQSNLARNASLRSRSSYLSLQPSIYSIYTTPNLMDTRSFSSIYTQPPSYNSNLYAQTPLTSSYSLPPTYSFVNQNNPN